MNKFVEKFCTLTDEQIHNIDRNIPECDELENAINNWFLDSIKYEEQEIVNNIQIEVDHKNIFSMMTMALWYRDGNHVYQSDLKYIKLLEDILSIKTPYLNSVTTLASLQQENSNDASHDLYNDVLGEATLLLGQYYSSCTTDTEIHKADNYLKQSRLYAPKTVASTLPVLAPAFGILGGLGLVGKIAAGLPILAYGAGAVAFAPAAPLLAIGGGIFGVRKLYKKLTKEEQDPYKDSYEESFPSKIKDKIKKSVPLSPEKKAIYAFGDLWYKLLPESQKKIVSAYKSIDTFTKDKDFDFSSIIIMLGTALEGELRIRFYDNYIKYLTDEFGTPQNYKEYNNLTNTQFDKRSRLFDRKNHKEFRNYYRDPEFTIGSYRYIIGIDQAGSYSHKIEVCDKSAIEYTKFILYRNAFFHETDEQINTFLTELSNDMAPLHSSRNKAAHAMNKISCEDVDIFLNDLIYTRKVLLRILDPTTHFAA